MLYLEATFLIKQSEGHMLLNHGTDSLKSAIKLKMLFSLLFHPIHSSQHYGSHRIKIEAI